MASRTTDTPNEDFDLTRLLWGDLPLVGEPPSAAGDKRHDTETTSASKIASVVDERRITETSSIRETPPPLQPPTAGSEPSSNAAYRPDEDQALGSEDDEDQTSDAEEELNIDQDIDLAAFAALAELANADFAADDPASEALEDEVGEFVLDERPLSYGELSQRLYKEILPRLRSLAASKGYLTLGYLARAVADLQDSDVHLQEVRAFVELIEAPVLPSRSHRGVRQLPMWAIRKAQRRFGDLLRNQIDERVVIERFGYTGVPLTTGTRAFLIRHGCGIASRVPRNVCMPPRSPPKSLAASRTSKTGLWRHWPRARHSSSTICGW
jgi:hypothetical protein